MDQPPLPEIKPYVNRNLFSDHFLDELLPQDDAWQVDEDKLKLAMQSVTNLYAGREEEWSNSVEAQLERKLVRPVLEALDQKFEVQPSLPTPEAVRRPDYAFFVNDEQREEALREHAGEIQYFDRVIAVGDAKRWDRPLDKGERGSQNKFDRLSPSWQIDYYLRMSGVKWGILTNGRLWRLYNQDTSFRLDISYEIDLPRLLAARDLEAFKYFYLFFRRQAFVPDAEGLCLLDRVYQGSLEYAQAVGDDLKENVYKALRLLAEGFLHTRDNSLDPERDLDEIHANSLVFLYRLLFINYAEDRGLLPRDNALYRDSYGLVSMEREIASKVQRRESIAPLQATYWGKLKTLFDLINQGSEALGIDAANMQVPPYNGGLFDPEKHPFLDQHKVEDRWLAQVIDLLSRSQAESVGGGFVDYSNLDVRHLGSIYEGLLEYKLRVADEEMVAVKRRGKEQWIPATEVGSSRVLDRVERGSVHLATDRGERKATGSYYTPDYIVKYIVEHTVGPLIEEKMQEDDPIAGILSLKVLDPAMGSGHFLVEATDRLAHALVEALGGAEEEPEEEDIRWARREVVERCIYGVDLNPLAVELAKLSLWLHTVAEGKPLNFLDHHLKVGNSLIGAWVEDLGSLPARTKKGKAKDADFQARQMNLFEIRLHEQLPVMLNKVLEMIRRRSDTLEDIKAKSAADQAVERLKAPFKAVADLWISTYFGNDVSKADYQKALEYIGQRDQLYVLACVKRAREIVKSHGFFHWELAFPEVFHHDAAKNRGFDAVVGNPPYVAPENQDKASRKYWMSNGVFDLTYGRFDVYLLFYERSLNLLRDGGQLGLITPYSVLVQNYARELRRFVLSYCTVIGIADLTQTRVFKDAGVDVIVWIIQKSTPPDSHRFSISTVDPESLSIQVSGQLDQSLFRRVPNSMVRLSLTSRTRTVVDKVERSSMQLGQVMYVITGCVVFGESGSLSGDPRGKAALIFDRPQTPYCQPYVEGKEIRRYRTPVPNRFLSYEPAKMHRPKFVELFENEKLFIRDIPGDRGLIATIDEQHIYSDHTLNCAVPKHLLAGVPHRDTAFSDAEIGLASAYDLGFLLAIVNARITTFWYQNLLSDGLHVPPEVVRGLPVPMISFSTSPQVRKESRPKAIWPLAQGDHRPLEDFVDGCMERHQTDVVHDLLAHLARQMIDMNDKMQQEASGFLDWLEGCTSTPVEDWRLKTIVQGYWQHPWNEIQRALRQNRKAIKEASGLDVESRDAQEAIQREFEKSMAKLNPLLERIEETDRLIDQIVYRLYGLTEEEVAIVEGDA
jgi:type I restriction-modification system DNA methylase subunit